MTSRQPSTPENDAARAVLADTAGIDTTSIAILGATTAHVEVVLPSTDEELDDADVVEGEDVALSFGGVDVIEAQLAAAEGAAEREASAPSDEASAAKAPAPAKKAPARKSAAKKTSSARAAAAKGDDAAPAARAPRTNKVAKKQEKPNAESPASPSFDEVLTAAAPVEESIASPLLSEHVETSVEGDASEVPAPTDAETGEVSVVETEQLVEATPAEPSVEANEEIAILVDEDEETAENQADARRDVSAVDPADEGDDMSIEPETLRTMDLSSKRIDDIAAEGESAELLTADRLLQSGKQSKAEPEGAWPRFLYRVSGRLINIGDDKKTRARKELTARIAAPVGAAASFVPVLSRKGGVGKTTVTTLLGMALADARDDRVIAIDANPDRGTLAERIERRSGKTVRDLVRTRSSLNGFNDLSAVVARDETRLDVLASDADPHVSEAFSDDDYRAVADVAAHYYSIVLTDTGTGIVHSVMGATLELADRIVIVAGTSVDEARLASETLTWLESNGHGDAARDAIVVINQTSPGGAPVRVDEVESHFRSRVRHVLRIPYDAHLATGSTVSFRELAPETRRAARELAALVVEALRTGRIER